MILKLVTAPGAEPVTLAEAKAHLRVDVVDDDATITGLIAAAREQGELVARRAFVTQTWELSLTCWPARSYIELPRPPLVSVTSISYVDSAGVTQTMSPGDYVVDAASEPGRVWLGYNKSWPSAALRPGASISVRYVAGYGAAVAVPARYKQAVLLLIGHFYENREEVIVQAGAMPSRLPFAAEALLLTDRGAY